LDNTTYSLAGLPGHQNQAGGSFARSGALTLYVAVSLCVAMTISQEDNLEVGSIGYWILIACASLLPLIHIASLTRTLLSRAVPLLLFAGIAGGWQLLNGDIRAAQQLLLIVWMLGWLSADDVHLRVRDLALVYLGLVAFGTVMWIRTDANMWGILPATTVYDLDWRISFFPNIAVTATLSLAVVFILTRTRALARSHLPVLCVALYFLLFSFVRTTTIALLLYLLMRWWVSMKPRTPRVVFWMAVSIGVGINVVIASSVYLFVYLQQFDLLSRLFLRSEANLTPEEIYAQIYRPWLWAEHIKLFWNSPFLMGLGNFTFFEGNVEELNVGTTPHGNESLPTRLLATYGLSSLLFVYYFLSRLYRLACAGDYWACCCFPAIILLMMQWGSIFHPTDSIGALFVLIAVRGHHAFLTSAKLRGKGRDGTGNRE